MKLNLEFATSTNSKPTGWGCTSHIVVQFQVEDPGMMVPKCPLMWKLYTILENTNIVFDKMDSSEVNAHKVKVMAEMSEI